jgi:hypothetical protein
MSSAQHGRRPLLPFLPFLPLLPFPPFLPLLPFPPFLPLLPFLPYLFSSITFFSSGGISGIC